MPPMSGIEGLCDQVDLLGEHLQSHGTVLINYFEEVEAITWDGIITPDESKLLLVIKRRTQRSHQDTTEAFEPVPRTLAELQDAVDLARTALHSGRVSKHVKYKALAAAKDAERICA